MRFSLSHLLTIACFYFHQGADDSQEELDSFLQLISQEMGEAPEEAGLAKETVRELHGQYTALRDRRQLRGPLPTSTVSLFHSLLVPLDSIVSAGIGALKVGLREVRRKCNLFNFADAVLPGSTAL